MKKAIMAIAALGVAGFAVAGMAGAQTSTSSSTYPGQSPGAEMTFTRNLGAGSQGNDVMTLQQFLNSNGYTIATSGPGSPGKESPYFGLGTQSALKKFQAANGISPANGQLGPKTKELIESQMKGGGTTNEKST